MNEPTRPAAPEPEKKTGGASPFRRTVTWVIVGVVALLAAYLAGSSSGWIAANAARRSTAELRVERDAALARGALQEARLSIYSAVIDLERRNYGTAASSVQEAARILEGIDAKVAGLNADKLADARTVLGGMDLNVTDDVQAQRTRLLEVADELRGALPPR